MKFKRFEFNMLHDADRESSVVAVPLGGADVEFDGPFGTAVDELVDIRVAAAIDLTDLTVPDQFALVEHGDPVGDFAGAGHVMGDRDGARTQASHIVRDQVV